MRVKRRDNIENKDRNINSLNAVNSDSESTVLELAETEREEHSKLLISRLIEWSEKKKGMKWGELSEIFNDELVDGQWYLVNECKMKYKTMNMVVQINL